MKVLDKGDIKISDKGFEFWVVETVEEQPPVFCISSKSRLQVYEFRELLQEDYDSMTFISSNTCQFCLTRKDNCSRRIAHPLSNVPFPLEDISVEDGKLGTEWDSVCEDCILEVSEFARKWTVDYSGLIVANVI